jgi:prepilin-type N-terminal cleavage/methylation domain-containing protein
VNSSQRGYSLIEALIAVAILGGVAAALAPATHSAIKAATRIAASASAAEIERAGDEAMAELFAQAISPGASPGHAFVGAPQSIGFHALADGEKGPRPARLTIDDDRLILAGEGAARAKDDPAGAGSIGRPIILLEGVRRFRFYGVRGADHEPSWSDQWRETLPPRLVAVEFAGAAQGDAPRSKMYSLKLRAPLQCAFDQVSRQCRQ